MPSLDRCLILIMHSEILGNDVDENNVKVPDEETNVRTIVLATLIAARTVTFDNMKYVIIHPAVRTASVHGSGSNYNSCNNFGHENSQNIDSLFLAPNECRS